MKKLTEFDSKIEEFAYWNDLIVPPNVLQSLGEIVDEIKTEYLLKREWEKRVQAKNNIEICFYCLILAC